MRLKLV